MSNYCLDTNIIYFLTNLYEEGTDNYYKQNSLKEKIKNISINDLFVNEIVKLEVQHAQYNYEENGKKVDYKHLTFHQKRMLDIFRERNKIIGGLKSYELDKKSLGIYKKFKFQNEEQKKDHCDFLIASICLANDLTLITDDEKCFNFINGLKFENWTK